ncbi:hypothetical protein PTSG_11414, partial [Salpingoeca rosetta]
MALLSQAWGWLSRPFRASHVPLNTAAHTRAAGADASMDVNVPKLGRSCTGSEFVQRVCQVADAVLAHHVKGRNRVDYTAVANSDAFVNWKAIAFQLQSLQLSQLSHDETMALFINVYNMATVHAIIHLGGDRFSGVLTVPKFWSTYGYLIGDHFFSLDDMEHGILRCNRAHPSSKRRTFWPTSDPRVAFLPTRFDHRIHFALVCGAR